MKILLSLAAAAGLSGCVAVPYDAAPVTYYDTYPYTYAYPTAPLYAAPAPVYVGPPVYFGFGLNYRSGGGYRRPDGWGYGHRHLDGYRGFGGSFRGGFRGR